MAGENTYWNRNGHHQEAYDRLKDLVPLSGPADTFEGEMLRASTKLYWDYFNNGFGNSWSGALEFLNKYGTNVWFDDDTGLSDVIVSSEYEFLSEYAPGQYIGNNKQAERIVESILDRVVDYVSLKKGVYTPSPCDMWSLDKPDDRRFEDDEEESEY